MGEKLILIGNGMAGIRAIEEILAIDSSRYEIHIFGDEPYTNYNRILLSNVLQGKNEFEEIELNPLNWYLENKLSLHVGEAVLSINRTNQSIETDVGTYHYDKLIIATGSLPFIPPVPGKELEGVTPFRTIHDTKYLLQAARQFKRATVIGGGILGLEAARGLMNAGMDVTVVHLMSHLMERQLDKHASTLLQTELEQQGMKFLFNAMTTEIYGTDRVEGIHFKDGRHLETDLVLMAAGIIPNISLCKEAGLLCERGVIVTDWMETSDSNIYALGECAQHNNIVYGLVAPLYEQAKILASRLCSDESTTGYEGSVMGTQLKVPGIDLYSAGTIEPLPHSKVILEQNEWDGTYKKIIITDNVLSGFILYGDTRDANRLFQLFKDRENLSDFKSADFFSTNSTSSSLIEQPENTIICGCNGVSKGTILSAISCESLTTIEEVKNCTNAGRSCGGCKPLIGELLQHVLGPDFQNQKESLCSCTTLSHEEVVNKIKELQLQTISEVRFLLNWNTQEGCSKCRPALNYYLGMLYPTDYKEERKSRLVNEKMHANIQRNGSYSVIPRMYGGVTTANDLRKIADAADKYQVPLIKITGGQRIALFGLNKGDLPSIWEDLDMPSGYAYGKSLRTVKTCVGENFCRFGTQDSISLGVRFEKLLEGLDTPHKIKMAVSACPRNCAESGVKDIGIVGVEGAWEVYIGGNGGTDLRGGDLAWKFETEEDVFEYACSFLQMYREHAHYLERTSKWVERIGLPTILEQLNDLDYRQQLLVRLHQSRLRNQHDPWKEIIFSPEKQRDFHPITIKE